MEVCNIKFFSPLLCMYRYVLHVTVVGYTVFFFDNVKGHEQAISKYGELWRYT